MAADVRKVDSVEEGAHDWDAGADDSEGRLEDTVDVNVGFGVGDVGEVDGED